MAVIKLVTQYNDSEDAVALLNKIYQKRDWMIQKKIIKKQNAISTITDEEIPYELPENWVWVRLNDVGQVIGGGTPKTNINEYWADGSEGIAWLTPADLSNYKKMYISNGRRNITSLGLEKSSATLLPKGSVLFSSRAPIGYVAIAENDISTNQGFKSIVPYVMEMNKYIYYYLMYVGEKINERATGTTFKEVSGKALSLELMPLPPLEEQIRIVNKIEKLFYLFDKCEQEISFQKRNIEFVRGKILDDALNGALEPQSEEEESAIHLVEKIQELKKDMLKNKKSKETKIIFDNDYTQSEIPGGWANVRIGDIALINPRNSVEDDLEVGFVPMKLIEDGYSGKHDFETRLWKDVKKGFTHFQENDIAIAKITPCFENKKSAIMRDLPNGYGAGTTELHIVRPFHDYVLAEYLMCLFKSNTFIEKGVRTYTGTAGQQRVSKDFIENYVIGLPPLSEQKRIVEKVKKLTNLIDEVERNMLVIK